MAHYSGVGPAYATASVIVQGTTRTYAAIFADVGLTVAIKNPFPVVAGVYDFYTAVAVFVAFGIDRPIYEQTDGVRMTFDEYQAPEDWILKNVRFR